MEIASAFKELIDSPEYKEICKQRDGPGGKYRSYKARSKAGTLGSGAMVELLIANGYEVTANKATKRTRKV